MRSLLLLCIATGLIPAALAQVSFQEGYFVDEAGARVDCLIKNVDWGNNPTSFEYKLSPAADSRTARQAEVREFGIDGFSKYVRATVAIDRSTPVLAKLDYGRSPTFAPETLFLKVLIEGGADLYEYVDGNLYRYFIGKGDAPIEQLVYKAYRVSPTALTYNTQYRQQLYTALPCPKIQLSRIEKLEYRGETLVTLFEDYNACAGAEQVNYTKLQRTNLLRVSVKSGISAASLSVSNRQTSGDRDVDFGTSLGFRAGVELEVALPFNRGRWRLFTEPTYHYLRADGQTDQRDTREARVKYDAIELTLGVRHYFLFGERSKLFANALFVKDLAIDSEVGYRRATGLVIEPNAGLAVGTGYKLQDKYSAELRYYANRNLFGGYQYWRSDYRLLSLVFGYTL